MQTQRTFVAVCQNESFYSTVSFVNAFLLLRENTDLGFDIKLFQPANTAVSPCFITLGELGMLTSEEKGLYSQANTNQQILSFYSLWFTLQLRTHVLHMKYVCERLAYKWQNIAERLLIFLSYFLYYVLDCAENSMHRKASLEKKFWNQLPYFFFLFLTKYL